MITVRVKYTPEELLQIIRRNVAEFKAVDQSKISKADLQLFAEQLHTLKLVDNRTGAPLGWLTKKLVLKRINEMLADDTGVPDPPDECGSGGDDTSEWVTIDW